MVGRLKMCSGVMTVSWYAWHIKEPNADANGGVA